MKKIFHIEGMHCVSCETRIKNACTSCTDCSHVTISHKTGILEVDYTEPETEEAIKNAVMQCGYTVSTNAPKTVRSLGPKSFDERVQLLAIFVGVAGLMRAVSSVNITYYIPDIRGSLSVGVAVLVGIIASVSTCLAVTGGLVIGFSEYSGGGSTRQQRLRIHGGFQLGRIIGFLVFGGLLGRIGTFLTVTLGAQGVVTLIIGLVFLYLGCSMLGLVPNITKLGFHLPPSRTARLHTATNPWLAPVVGALTFFVPCGFTQSMQLLALGSGSIVQGAILMGAFALGTMPVLIAIGVGSSYRKDRNRKGMHRVLGSVLVVFGLFSLQNGGTLLGFTVGDTIAGERVSISEAVPVHTGAYQTIAVQHNGFELTPSLISLKAGGNYVVTITPEKNGLGCMSTLLIPKLEKTVHSVVAGAPVTYTFTAIQPGSYPVVCASMGMSHGTIVVE